MCTVRLMIARCPLVPLATTRSVYLPGRSPLNDTLPDEPEGYASSNQ